MNKNSLLVGMIGLFGCAILGFAQYSLNVQRLSMPAPTATPGDLQAQVLLQSAHDDLGPRWSPDGNEIAFVGHDAGNPDVFVYDLANHTTTNETQTSRNDDFNPIWSPDGKQLVYMRRRLHSGPLTQYLVIESLATGVSQTVLDENGYMTFLGWFADSSAFLFSRDNTVYRYDVTQQSAHVLFTGNDSSELYPSPNGQLLVVSQPSNGVSLVIDSRTGERETLPQSSYLWPCWSPDSQRFAFMSVQPRWNISLYIWDVASKKERQLIGPHGNAQLLLDVLSWSADGRLAWVSSQPNLNAGNPDVSNHIITVFDTKTGQRHNLVTINQPIDNVMWSPTRDELAFTTFSGVYVVDVPSGVYRDFIQGFPPIQELSWSPDGDYVESKMGYNWACPGKLGLIDIRSGTTYLYGQYVCGIQWRPRGHSFIFNGSPGGAEAIMLITLPG